MEQLSFLQKMVRDRQGSLKDKRNRRENYMANRKRVEIFS